MKLNYIFTALLFIVLLSSCEESEISFPEIAGEVGFTGDRSQIEEFFDIDPNLFDAFLELDLNVFEGSNPPLLNGSYLISPFTLFGSNIPDEGFPIGEIFSDLNFTISNQDTFENTLNYLEVSSGSPSQSFASLISGSGNNFTMFLRTQSQSQGDQGNVVNFINGIAISGSITDDGINNFQYIFVVTQKSNDTNNEFIEAGEGRLFIDGDGLVQFQ